jgi:hypothetical protein
MKTIGPYISRGCWKSCYQLKEVDDRVALVWEGNGKRAKERLLEEKAHLDMLIKLGVPALVTRLSRVKMPNGKTVWALTAPKYDFALKVSNGKDYQVTPAHLKTLRKMRKVLDEKKIDIDDLQFLFKRGSDEVVIADPLGVSVSTTNPSYSAIALGELISANKPPKKVKAIPATMAVAA